MSLWNKIFKKRSLPAEIPPPPQADQATIDELERQLLLSPEYDIIDGIYTGETAKQWLQEQGMYPPDTPLPLNVVDTSQVRFSDIDKNLPIRLNAIKRLAHTRSRQAVEVLENALRNEGNEVVESAILRSLKDIAIREIKRQGGHNYVRIYKQMSSGEDYMPSLLPLFDRGFIFYLGIRRHPKSIDFLQQLIVAEDSHVRQDATLELVNLGREHGLPEITHLLIDLLKTDPSPNVRGAAAESLGNLVDSTHYPFADKRGTAEWLLLKDHYSQYADDIKKSAATSLGNYKISDVFSILLPYLSDPDAQVRASAIESCLKVESILTFTSQNYSYNQKEIDLLKKVLNDSDPRICAFAASQLQKIGVMDEFSALLASCVAPNAITRREIALKLGAHNNSRSIQELCKMLTDSDEFVRINAARSLSKIGDESIIDDIVNAMQGVGQDVRFYFVDAISDIRQRHSKA